MRKLPLSKHNVCQKNREIKKPRNGVVSISPEKQERPDLTSHPQRSLHNIFVYVKNLNMTSLINTCL